MKKKTEQEKFLEKALTLDDKQRADLVTQINDSKLRHHIEGILNDQQTITQHFNQKKPQRQNNSESKQDEMESGTKINRITIEKLLGKGGMGSVYQGYDEKLKRKVAIKSIRGEYLRVESTHQRFIREAQILSKINHPSICHIYDYIETENRDYLVLELIKGKQLNQMFLEYDDLLKILLELSKALAAAHKHGIVHRDLKPDNIMITDENKVKVLDFGIAQSLGSSLPIKTTRDDNSDLDITQMGSIVGTIRYMSPEQAGAGFISTASDIYSLGIIIQELFSHENAYETMQSEELLFCVQNGDIKDFNCSNKSIKKLVHQLCQVDPENRPSAIEVCHEIEQILQAPKKRIKRIIQACVLITIMLLIVAIGWQWQQSQYQNQSAELAKTYTGKINQLVRESEQIYVLPLHNTQPEIEHVLEKGAELYIQIANDPKLNDKDKMQLHGLIYLESEDFESAVSFLEKSEANHTLLARAWIGLYIDKASEYSSTYGVSKMLQADELKSIYLTPAIKYINSSSQEDAVHEAFKVALIESLDAGVVLLDNIIQEHSWDKKAIRLKTQILLTQAEKSRQLGDWDTAKELYLKTIKTFEKAIDMARSYPDSYLGLCQVNNVLLFDGLQRTGQNAELYARNAIQACENYLSSYPNDQFAINLLARIHIIKAQGEMLHELDPTPHIESAKYWIQQSPDSGDDFTTLWTQGLLHTVKAEYALQNGQLDDTEINQAIEFYKKSIQAASDTQVFLSADLIYAYALQAELMVRNNKDISPVIREAELIFEQSLKNPSILIGEKRSLYINMGTLYYVRMIDNFIYGKSITQNGDQLLEIFRLATNDLLDEPIVELSIANVHLLLAQANINNIDIAYQHLKTAKQSTFKAKQINDQNPVLMTTQLWILSLYSNIDNSNYEEIESLFDQSIISKPNNAQIYYLWANHLYLKSQNKSFAHEKNILLEMAIQKIRQALIIDHTNKTYLNLQKKIKIIKNK